LPALEHAHKLAPTNNAALYFLARAHIGVQHWQEAYELFSQFARRVPGFAPTYYALGWLDIKLNRTAEARRNLGHCLTLAPDHADARYELAQLELDAGNLDAAEKLLGTVLARNPKHAKANLAFGDILLRKGQLAEAQTYYETAIQEDPKFGPAHYKMSTLLFRLHRNDEAEKERALGAQLNAEALKSSKTVFQLASPDGTILNTLK
jgi:tetratricopeptide (TPR) repeat protein